MVQTTKYSRAELHKRRKAYTMQRTVYSTKFTYVDSKVNPDGTITANLATIEIPETDEKRAYKKARDILNHDFHPIITEKVSALWVLDDDIFFKYAVKQEPTEPTETETE